MESSNLTRRQALKILMGAGSLLALSPQIVFADTSSDLAQTESDLDDAQARLDQVQAQLDQIAAEYTALAQKQAQTLDQIEAKQGEIDATQEQIDQKQTDLEEKQDRLAKRVSSSYKTGDNDVLSVMLNSTSMNDLTSNLYYLSKISDQDRRLIEDDKQEHRLRFTQGHEAGHGIFHTQCFYRDPNQLSLFSLLDAEEDIPMIRCRTDSIFSHASSDPRNWSDNERMEWQANAMSSALLLPRPAVRHLFEVNGRTGSRCSQIIKTIYDLIDECNVSHEAALYRLKDLGIVQTNEVRSFMPGSSLMDFGRLL